MTEVNSYEQWRDEKIANAEKTNDQPAANPTPPVKEDTDNSSDTSK